MTALPHNHHQEIEHTLADIPSPELFSQAADMLKILGDPSRIRIFWILCHCEECVMNLSAMVDMTSPAVSHHLKLLKTSGLITSRREGKEMYYTVANNERALLLHHTIEHMIEVSCPYEHF